MWKRVLPCSFGNVIARSPSVAGYFVVSPHACAAPLPPGGAFASFVGYQLIARDLPARAKPSSLFQELIMAKRVFRFPISAVLLAVLFVSIPVLADNFDLASAQPDFDRAVTSSYSGFNNNSELFSRDRPENWMADGRFITELRSFACEFQSGHGCITEEEISFHHGDIRDYPDFEKSGRDGDFDWRKHPSSVPEPASLSLLGTSVLVVAFSLRKRLQR